MGARSSGSVVGVETSEDRLEAGSGLPTHSMSFSDSPCLLDTDSPIH